MEHDDNRVMMKAKRTIWMILFCKLTSDYFAKVEKSNHFCNNEIGTSDKNDVIELCRVDS